MIRRAGRECSWPFCKPACGAKVQYCKEGQGQEEEGCKIYLQAGNYKSSPASLPLQPTFSIRNFGLEEGGRGMHAVEILHLSVVYN